MSSIIANSTPVRTSKNYNINDIKLDNIKLPAVSQIKDFTNGKIVCPKDVCMPVTDPIDLSYGNGDVLTNLIKNHRNYRYKIIIDTKCANDVFVDLTLTDEDKYLIDDIQIIAQEGVKANVYIKYSSKTNQGFHNGLIRIQTKENSNIAVNIINFLDDTSANFIAIDTSLAENSKLNCNIIDLGACASITNYYSKLEGKSCVNNLNSIYLGNGEKVIDMNYIGHLYGEKSEMYIESQGAINGNCKKHFKGTLDFKTGCKKAIGDENEFCVLLSDTAKAISLPMLLCSEEDVVGNHSTAAGKIGKKELFYIMSRGFTEKQAKKLLIRANFNKIINNIKDEDIKAEILEYIDKAL